MSDEAMIKAGQSPGKYSKTVPRPCWLLLLLLPPAATQFMPEIRQRRICVTAAPAAAAASGAAETEVKYGRRHARVMV